MLLGSLNFAAFCCFLLVGCGVSNVASITSCGRIISSLTGERGCSYQREETLWRDRATGNIIDEEGKGEEASSREEVQE